jgi:DNA-binding NarL/FixJ family response regulator/thioredoxin-like negative regulator of GroEL
MNEFDGLNALIIEPHAGMRSTIHNMLTQCGLTRVDHVGGSNQAVKHLAAKHYDLILCEYALEGGQDGQQLLEDVRHHKLMPMSTMFFMVTAEGDYGKVVSAAELGPTDYILKPFTADRLFERIARGLERRNALLPVIELMEAGSQREAIDACLEGEARHPRYLIDFMRLRAELHMFLGEPEQAEPIYQRLIDTKAIAWARLGLAKTLFLRERYGDAQGILQDLVDTNKNFVDAYDWLARTHEAVGELDKAKTVLGDAVGVSPHAVRRLRKLGETALEAGDHDTAEKIFKQVVSKARYSEFKDPQDHVLLVQTLVRKGDPVQAAAVIRDLDKSMAFQKHATLCSAIAASMVHEYTGNDTRLNEALGAALAASRNAPELRPELKLELARVAIDNHQAEGAAEVMREVMRNAQNGAAMAKAMAVFEQAGHAELARQLASESRQQVVDLVASGATRAREGDFKGAVTLMEEAVTKLPDNPQVAFNAALAVLKCLDHEGWDERLGQQALRYIGAVRRLDPVNPKLPALAGLHLQIQKKYDKGARPKKAVN